MSNSIIIICNSQTEAQRVVYYLSLCGLNGYTTKPPRDKQRTSCTYGVKIKTIDKEKAAKCLADRGFKYKELL